MEVVIRTDGSREIGTGHVMRCLTLARELRSKSSGIFFICRKLPGDMIDMIRDQGFTVFAFAAENWREDSEKTAKIIEKIISDRVEAPGWLVVDHYNLDRDWQEKIRLKVKRVMVIDDLGDRNHRCDLLLDQNLFDNMESHYASLVNSDCRLLLGPSYALLRPEFRQARKNLRKRDGRVNRIMIFMGGSDPANLTQVAIEALNMVGRKDIMIDVVVGINNPHREKIREICAAGNNLVYHCQVNNMAELMAGADLAIGARGSATWERCVLGLPAITIAIADNQEGGRKSSLLNKAEYYLGTREEVDSVMIAEAAKALIDDRGALLEMGQEAYRIMEGSECGPERVVEEMIKDINN